MHRSIPFLILIFGCLSCYAQVETIKLSGVIYDSATKEPIEYANIYVTQTAVGTVSSRLGDFELNIPKAILPNTVTISCIGYQSRFIPIDHLADADVRIQLNQAAVLLKEVAVVEQLDSGLVILKKAIKAIDENYPTRKHLLEGFYRELSVRDTVYTRLIEASILVQERSYSKKSFDKETLDVSGSRVQIQALRKSDDYRTYDKAGSVMNFVFGSKNDLYEIFEDNYIRFLGIKSPHFLSDNFLKDYEITLKGKTELDGEVVYVVQLRSNTDLFFLREVDLYIGRNDFAFLRIENSLLINKKDSRLMQAGINGKYFYHGDISYRKIGDRYVPFVIRTQKYASNTNPLVKSAKGTELQYMDLTFLLTDFSERDFSKIKKKETVDRNKDIRKIDWPYDEDFWKNYNMILLHPINEKVKSELEKETDLETQFRKN